MRLAGELHSFTFAVNYPRLFLKGNHLTLATSGIQSKVVDDVFFHNGMCFPRLEILCFFNGNSYLLTRVNRPLKSGMVREPHIDLGMLEDNLPKRC